MPRKTREMRPLIYVFSEGETEQEYVKFLKEYYEDTVIIKQPKDTGLFEEAKDKFNKDIKYKESAEVTDEIWFFYDVEKEDIPKWEQRLKIINQLRKLRKNPKIRVRLLMTTACIEYWLLLHYKYTKPPITTPADKERVQRQVQAIVPEYIKGDPESIKKIAANFPTAIKNGDKVLNSLNLDGIPTLDDTDERNAWLSRCGLTFTTVHEALKWLEDKKQSK